MARYEDVFVAIALAVLLPILISIIQYKLLQQNLQEVHEHIDSALVAEAKTSVIVIHSTSTAVSGASSSVRSNGSAQRSTVSSMAPGRVLSFIGAALEGSGTRFSANPIC